MSRNLTSGRRRRLLQGAAVGAGALGLGLYLGHGRSTPEAPSPAAEAAVEQLWTLTLPDAQGQSVALSTYAGRLCLVNFWATWCPPCVEEMPELSALHAELSGEGLAMLGIGIDSPSRITDFSAKSPVTYPLLVAGMSGTELARALGNTSGALPFTVLITAEGQIAYRYLGRVKIDAVRTLALDLLRRPKT